MSEDEKFDIGEVSEWDIPRRSAIGDLYVELAQRLMALEDGKVLTVNFVNKKIANNRAQSLKTMFRREFGQAAVMIRIRHGGAYSTLYIAKGTGWKHE